MSTTTEDKRKKRRYLLLLLLFLLGILILIFFLFRLNGDSTTSAPAGAPSASAPAAASAASDAITAPGLPALEAYANGTSIGWQVTANSNDGGSPYAGYEIELISESKDIHADFPGDGSGAGMYAWTFGGQPTVMARTYNEAGLASEWAAMLLPVVDPNSSDTLTTNASPKSVQAQPDSGANGANRVKPASLIGESPERILSLELLPPVMTGATPAERIRPADMPTPSATPTEMPVTPAAPSADPTPSSSATSSASPTTSASATAKPTSSPSSSPSPTASPTASPKPTRTEGDDSRCKDGKKKHDGKCEDDDHPRESPKASPTSSHGEHDGEHNGEHDN